MVVHAHSPHIDADRAHTMPVHLSGMHYAHAVRAREKSYMHDMIDESWTT